MFLFGRFLYAGIYRSCIGITSLNLKENTMNLLAAVREQISYPIYNHFDVQEFS